MGRALKLSLHERGQVKALSTVRYTVKQIADIVKHSRKAVSSCLLRSEESRTTKSSGRPDKFIILKKDNFAGNIE
uniref:HTH_38 domain-containing protein n=1 Tax=Heterorhabditis bacteriophora TaxID=37862 RepID=A0A1I7XPE1_HETBA